MGMCQFNEESDQKKRTLLSRFLKDEFFIEGPLFLRIQRLPILLFAICLQTVKSKVLSPTSAGSYLQDRGGCNLCYMTRFALNRCGSILYFVILYWMIRFVVPRNLAALLWLPRASFRASMIRERS